MSKIKLRVPEGVTNLNDANGNRIIPEDGYINVDAHLCGSFLAAGYKLAADQPEFIEAAPVVVAEAQAPTEGDNQPQDESPAPEQAAQ